MQLLRWLTGLPADLKNTSAKVKKRTNLIMIDEYSFDKRHHMLEDAEHQLHKVDDRIGKIKELREARALKGMDTDEMDRILASIVQNRGMFLDRTVHLRECSEHEWDEAKLKGKAVNDLLLSWLAHAERSFGLEVGEGKPLDVNQLGQ